MSNQKETNLTIEKALKIVREYSCIQVKTVDAKIDKEELRQALLMVTSISQYENIGVCADNAQEGFATLLSYLKALGYETNFEANYNIEGQQPVYIKYNTQKQSHYLDSYTGSYRGVLISCQGDDEALVGTYGHFPLDLFM